MKDVNFLIGSYDIDKTSFEIFSDDACDLLSKIESTIRKDREARLYPDVISVGYWCRKANIQKKKEEFSDGTLRIGRGLAFHITPGNIPVNFFFSFLFALLGGNANIVRVPSKDFPQIRILLRILKECLVEFPEIEKRVAFVKYDRSDEITGEFSKIADVRVIWGGDRTVAKVREMPSKPRCIDIAFADRFSVAVIDSKSVCTAEPNVIERLVTGFYNDTYLMDQNACSSPRLIFWTGNNEEGKERFWLSLYEKAKKSYNLQASVAVDKYTRLCQDLMDRDDIAKQKSFGNLLNIISLKGAPEDTKSCEGFGGYFYQTDINDFSEISKVCDERLQTITYFGIDPKELAQDIIKNNCLGCDRIVPIGQAMDIDLMWDGFDLIRTMSRKIDIR